MGCGSQAAVGALAGQVAHPASRNLLPAPETFATKAAAGRWLDAERTDLERGVAIDERATNRPLKDWWPDYLR